MTAIPLTNQSAVIYETIDREIRTLNAEIVRLETSGVLTPTGRDAVDNLRMEIDYLHRVRREFRLAFKGIDEYLARRRGGNVEPEPEADGNRFNECVGIVPPES